MVKANGTVWVMFAFCINKLMKNVRGCVCRTATNRCYFPMVCKTFKHGSAYLTQLEYIINLLFRIAQPFNAKRSKDNIAEFLTKRRKKTKVMT